MQTAIISDLHFGSLSGRDLLRDPVFRDILLSEIEQADRIVVLGDLLELFDLPLKQALAYARPFLEDLGAAMAGRIVVLVPGNHDHRIAEPILGRLAAESRPLGLEHRAEPSGAEAERLATWLGAAKLEIAYPGIWLREDVYATHGHYMDCYRRLPRLECIAAATAMRARPLPIRPTPHDYERTLSPVYSTMYGLAQVGLAHRVTHPSEQIWRAMSNGSGRRGRRVRSAVLRGGAAAGIRLLNLALRSDLTVDVAPGALSRTGITAATELARRLDVGAAHLITGHTHRAGPAETETAWALPSGGRLHNTGSWILTSAFQDLDGHGEAYLPGTVTWLDESGSPYRTNPLANHSDEALRLVAGRLAIKRREAVPRA